MQKSISLISRICDDCLKFISRAEKFIETTCIVQKMFEELSLSTKSKNFEELNYIRIKFGFSELEIDPTIFCKTLTIKQEKLDDEDGKFQL